MRINGEMCSAQSPSSGVFCDRGASGKYSEQLCIWKGEISSGIWGITDCDLDLCLLSDLCFFDFFWLSSLSRFRFFSPCDDLSFFEDFDSYFSECIAASAGGVGVIIDILGTARPRS